MNCDHLFMRRNHCYWWEHPLLNRIYTLLPNLNRNLPLSDITNIEQLQVIHSEAEKDYTVFTLTEENYIDILSRNDPLYLLKCAVYYEQNLD